MNVKSELLFYILFLHYVYVYNDNENSIVHAKVGSIRGLRATDGAYFLYLGIPYAKVDEENPFGISIPVTNLTGIFHAYQDSAACPQVNATSNIIIGDLNCLQLNVYVPTVANYKNVVPVMVWIHGGGFYKGDASRHNYGPKFLMKQNVILVTINYRLGPYGFMCLDIPEVPGNQGLKDQLIAIKWIKDNIEAFGGDINKITLFGNSAGAQSIDLHFLSLHDNLFNNVIMESGSSLAATLLYEPDKSAPIAMAAHLGFKTDSVHAALRFLATKDTKSVIDAATKTNIKFKPCVEKDFNSGDSFITAPWINASMPKLNGMSILIGSNNKERYDKYENYTPDLKKNLNLLNELLNRTFIFNADYLVEMKKIIYHFYEGDRQKIHETRESLGMFDSDYTYIHPVQRSIAKYIKDSAAKIYYYIFSYDGGRNFGKYGLDSTIVGAIHEDEIGYIFDPSYMAEEPSPQDQMIIDQMTTMWANFAKHNDPTPNTSDLLPVKWAPVTEDVLLYLSIDSKLSLQSRPFKERMAFWELFYTLNWKLQRML